MDGAGGAARPAAKNHLSSEMLEAVGASCAFPSCCLPPTTPPAHNSTRYWLLDCEIGGGGGDATGSRRCKPDMEVRTDRGGWRGSGERTFARGKTGGRSGICAAERSKRGEVE